jgi:uncharacterized protein (TIGR02391 family)
MLSLSTYHQLATLMSDVYGVIERVQSGAAIEEIELRVQSARRTLDLLQAAIGADPTKGFDALARHLHFLLYYHKQGDPTGYASDIEDMRERDLPAILKAIEGNSATALDPGLAGAIGPSWEAQHYSNAVRDAFIHLETVLREAGNVAPDKGLSGVQLATAVLGPKSPTRITLSSVTALGPLTSGEADGAYNLVKGAFQVYRNATAHRVTRFTSGDAEDVVRLVNLCLQLLPMASKPSPA